MRRREFIALVGGAASATAASVVAARAQQVATSVVGMLNPQSPGSIPYFVDAFRRGLAETSYVEGHNVAIEYRWAEDRYDRIPELVADLVARKVSVIAAPSNATALAAKAATSVIPIVFGVGEDPVKLGLVASLAQPGGNATGINFFTGEVVTKRLGVLRELVPAANRIAVLVNPANSSATSSTLAALERAAPALGMQIQVYNASSIGEIDAVFIALVRERAAALFVAPDPFFQTRRVQLALLAARHALPATFPLRQYTEAGGLVSYGTSLIDVYRQVGVYTGRVLSGANPADLPVQQTTKFELVINHETARMLGLDVPPTLLAQADEVIE